MIFSIDFTHDLMHQQQPQSSEASDGESFYQSTSKLPQCSEILQQDVESDKVYTVMLYIGSIMFFSFIINNFGHMSLFNSSIFTVSNIYFLGNLRRFSTVTKNY